MNQKRGRRWEVPRVPLLLVCALMAHGQPLAPPDPLPGGIPPDALVLESAAVPKRADRSLLLWMRDAVRRERPPAEEEAYTCPERTQGSLYFTGRVWVSLVDTPSHREIHRVEIPAPPSTPLRIPQRLAPSDFYHVEPPLVKGDGRPLIFRFRDWNGDGAPLEFAFYEAEACSSVLMLLMGYRSETDRLWVYPFHLESPDADFPGRNTPWQDVKALQDPVAPGGWNTLVPWNSGIQWRYRIHYDAATATFRGVVSREPLEPDSESP